MEYRAETPRQPSGTAIKRRSSIFLRWLVCVAVGNFLSLGCGGGTTRGSTTPPNQPASTPAIATTAAQNGAVIVTLTDSTSDATLHYTTDGTTPTNTSPQYFAPFLVASNMTVKAIAAAPPLLNSSVASQTFSASIPSGTLVWSDEFSKSTVASSPQPNPAIWTYDTGYQCCGNNEQETYCAWDSATSPCTASSLNTAIAPGLGLKIVARNPSGTNYTSARLKTQGLFSFQYGRIEASMQLPESQGMWPAFWLLGNNIATIEWPACGEADIMEHIDGNNPPPYVGAPAPGYDWIAGSVHGGTSSKHADGTQQYHPAGFSAAGWHTYGMIWSKGQIQYYVDDPANIYATFNTANFNGSWPFDQGPMFIILNLAVGGDWPGNVNSSTVFPSTMLVQYVRIYTN
jgi:beta-glucanase (GH16 family)